MTSEEFHKYLLSLKNKNSQDPNIVEYKRKIREELYDFRKCTPRSNLQLKKTKEKIKNVVFYSFMDPKDKPKIADHEYKRRMHTN